MSPSPGGGLLAQLSQPEPRAPLPSARSFRKELALLLNAGIPLLYVDTYEEQRALAEIVQVAGDSSVVRTPRQVYSWSLSTGFRKGDDPPQASTQKPADAVPLAEKIDEAAVVVFRDLNVVFGEGGRPTDPLIIRRLRDIAQQYRAGRVPRTMILLSPQLDIPTDLEKDATVVDFPLPSEQQIRASLDAMIDAYQKAGVLTVSLDEVGLEKLAKAANGLTITEAQNAFAKAMADGGKLDDHSLGLVLEAKRQAVRASGVMDSVPVDIGLSDVGGLENLKRWLDERNGSWLDSAAAYGLPAPKGVLIVGVPGCGKSLTAKAVSAAWSLPLLSLDIGKMFAGLVGSSERNMRNAIRVAEASAPCVLWIDEVEKGFAGIGSAADSGTTTRVFGEFLSWMQEKTASVFVIATANEVDKLPPEFLRKGRFDEIFFVDLPTTREREAIWQVQLHRYLAGNPAGSGLTLDAGLDQRLSAASAGFSGSEIESAVTAAMFDAYHQKRAVAEADLLHALKITVPLSVTEAEQITAIRHWANTRAVAATAQQDVDASGSGSGPDSAQDSDSDAALWGRPVDF